MKAYQKTITEAITIAKDYNIIVVVYEIPTRWWQKKKYAHGELGYTPTIYPVIMTCTPSGKVSL